MNKNFKSIKSMTVENFQRKYGRLMKGVSDKCKAGIYLVAEGTEENPEETTVFVSGNLKATSPVCVSLNDYGDGAAPSWCLQNTRELSEFNLEDLFAAEE